MSGIQRAVRRAFALVPLLVLPGCLGPLLFFGLCASLGGSGDHGISITAPGEGESFSEPFLVRFDVIDASADVRAVAYANGVFVGEAFVTKSAGWGEIRVSPDQDSGPLMVVLDSGSTYNNDEGYGHDEVTVQWIAPWAIDSVEVCQGSDPEICAPLGAELVGTVRVTPTMRRDAARIARVRLEIDGATRGEADAPPWTITADLSDLADGEHAVRVVAVRDDGAEAELGQTVSSSNCGGAAEPRGDSFVIYGEGGWRFDSTLEGVTISNLATDAQLYWFLRDDAYVGPLAFDGERYLYAASSNETGALHRRDVLTGSELLLAGPEGIGFLGLAVADDGALYASHGVRGYTEAQGGISYLPPGGVTSEVTVAPLAADSVLVDDDGTLLVTAGDTLWRLTVATGLETSRTPVLTRSNAQFTHIGKDSLGRYYLVEVNASQVLRYADVTAPPEIVHQGAGWTLTTGPDTMSFLAYPTSCYGLVISGHGPTRRPELLDVGAVRGRP